MKRYLLLLLLTMPLFFSCGKAFRITTPDMVLDGNAQTKTIKASCSIYLFFIYEWSVDEEGNLAQNDMPSEEYGTHCKGDWYEIEVDKNNWSTALLTLFENNTGHDRKLTIVAEYEGKGDRIYVTQKSL